MARPKTITEAADLTRQRANADPVRHVRAAGRSWLTVDSPGTRGRREDAQCVGLIEVARSPHPALAARPLDHPMVQAMALHLVSGDTSA